MDDERWEPGMPVLDRQAVPEPNLRVRPRPASSHRACRASRRDRSRRSAPTPLQRHYINLSVIVLICGAIAITALELGAPLGSPLVKLCVLIATPLLAHHDRRRRPPHLALGLGVDAGRPGQGPVPPRLGRGERRRADGPDARRPIVVLLA